MSILFFIFYFSHLLLFLCSFCACFCFLLSNFWHSIEIPVLDFYLRQFKYMPQVFWHSLASRGALYGPSQVSGPTFATLLQPIECSSLVALWTLRLKCQSAAITNCHQWRAPYWPAVPESCSPLVLYTARAVSSVIYNLSTNKLSQVCLCVYVLFNSQFGSLILMAIEFWVDSFISSFSVGKILHFLRFPVDSIERAAIL